jgi:hypothetical protein
LIDSIKPYFKPSWFPYLKNFLTTIGNYCGSVFDVEFLDYDEELFLLKFFVEITSDKDEIL